MKRSLQLVMCALATVNAAGGNHADNRLGGEFNTKDEKDSDNWSYMDNGANWGKKTAAAVPNNECGKVDLPQSPVDLKSNWPKKMAMLDRFSKVYTDQTTTTGSGAVTAKVYNNGHVIQTPVDNDG